MRSPDDEELAAEIAEVRAMLDRRYDEIVSGKVQGTWREAPPLGRRAPD